MEELLARLFPDLDVPASIRPLGSPPSPAPLLCTTLPPAAPTTAPSSIAVAAAALPTTPLALEHADSQAQPIEAPPPLAAKAPAQDRFEIRLTAKADTVAKLKMVQDLLSHAVPSGDLAEVLDRALTALAEKLLRTKFAVTNAPRKSSDSPSGIHESAAVKRAVYLRDRGQCTYVSKNGRRCDSRRFLQFDHVLGRAVGGAFTVDNVRLRCGPHNRLEAERLYGTPPRARDAGGARVDLTRVHPACGYRR